MRGRGWGVQTVHEAGAGLILLCESQTWMCRAVLGGRLWFPPPQDQSVRSQQPFSSTSLVTTNSTSHRP